MRPLELYEIKVHPSSNDEIFAFYYGWVESDTFGSGKPFKMTQTILNDIRWDVEQWEKSVYGNCECQFVEFRGEITMVWYNLERATLFRLTWV